MKDEIIVKIAKERFSNPLSQLVHFVNNPIANKFLNNLTAYPHTYVLACLMDRQIQAERAWIIPYEVYKELGFFDINRLHQVRLEQFIEIFNNKKLHRFNDTMANIFFNAINDIIIKYKGDASNIWNNNPSSSSVVYRFLEFKGGGIKIATMAANILARQFRIPFSDYYSIDISPDVHIKRVLQRMGYIPEGADINMIIYKARELNPEFPGIIDFSCWEIGRTWCRPSKPDCYNCVVNSNCKKIY